MVSKATARNTRIAVRKARMVIDMIRGRQAGEALQLLEFTPKSAAPIVKKLLESAVANARQAQPGLDLDALLRALGEAEASGEPYALLGATYAFVPVMDALAERGRRFGLPAGSLIFDTGGFKGQSREIDPDTFYDGLSHAFGVPRDACLNMYGMTELSTQFYDDGNAVCPLVADRCCLGDGHQATGAR